MRKGKLCFVILFPVLFYWPNLALSDTVLFPPDSISSIPDLVLEQRGDKADVFFSEVPAISKRFPVVAVLQGAGVDKSFYTEFGTQLARYGFVVVIPNHFQILPFPPFSPSPLSDQFVVLDVQAQMELEDADPASPLFGIVDTESFAPYDLKGTRKGVIPAPFDTRTLKDGSHTVRAEIVFPSGVQPVASKFLVSNDSGGDDYDDYDDD